MLHRSSKQFLNSNAVSSYWYLKISQHKFSTSSLSSQPGDIPLQFSREDFQSFDNMVMSRRQQASRTVAFEVDGIGNSDGVYSYCARHGKVANIFEYFSNDKSKKVLVEFEDKRCLHELLKASCCSMEGQSIPITIPFIKLSRLQGVKVKSEEVPEFPVKKCFTKQEMNNSLQNDCNSISEQMTHLYENLKMNEIGWRLRFLACRKVEWLLPAFLQHGRALPFGSSVNTFGNNFSDVDMTLDFENVDTGDSMDGLNVLESLYPVQSGWLICSTAVSQPVVRDSISGGWSKTEEKCNSELKILSRHTVQKNVDIFASIMTNYKLCFSNVMRILNARVPIIKCYESFTSLECDISIQNMSGYYMSELLYLYGCSDVRVRPLVYSIRWWTSQRNIAPKTSPSSRISNFTLTLMVLFFLMSREPKVVYPISFLNRLSDSSFEVEDITYSYVRDVSFIPPSLNTQTLEELFREFFEFYQLLNLKKIGLSLITGKIFSRDSQFPLFVQNPIDPSLNVSKNVNYEEIEKFKEECQLALHKFDYIMNSKANFFDQGGILAFGSSFQLSPHGRKKEQRFDIKAIMRDGKNHQQLFREAERMATTMEVQDKKGKHQKGSKRVKVL